MIYFFNRFMSTRVLSRTRDLSPQDWLTVREAIQVQFKGWVRCNVFRFCPRFGLDVIYPGMVQVLGWMQYIQVLFKVWVGCNISRHSSRAGLDVIYSDFVQGLGWM